MNEPSILVIQEYPGEYRLNMYLDFVQRLPTLHPNTKIYGKDYPTYRAKKNIDDIIRDDLGGVVPDILFIFSPDFAPSNLKKLKTKVVVFLSDSLHTNGDYLAGLRKHSFDCYGVFHNYLYGQELIKPAFQTKNTFYWPCWAGCKYDYQRYQCPKNIDFFLSGTLSTEYSYRKVFSDLFRGSNMSFVNRYGMWKDSKADNDLYLKHLCASHYSPHDGGIHGRMQGRFYESSFMRSVVIAPDLGEEMRKNGFEHGINSILFDRNRPVEEIKDMLKHIETYDWITLSNNAYSLIKDRHTTDHRIKSFLDVVLN